MAANFNVGKMHHIIERIHGCEYSIEIIIVGLKDHIAEIINSKSRKMQTRITLNMDTFHAVNRKSKVLLSKLIQYPSKN